MIDYLLTAAVGISAGVGALVSAVPRLQSYMLPLCLATLVILTVANLRGVREVGALFALPTYLFIASLLATIALGVIKTLVAKSPALRAGLAAPELIVLSSPARYVISPILDYVLDLERRHPEREIAVLIPEMVERHWYHFPLHNQRAQWLKALLWFKGSQRINVISVPWYLRA